MRRLYHKPLQRGYSCHDAQPEDIGLEPPRRPRHFGKSILAPCRFGAPGASVEHLKLTHYRLLL